MQASAIVELYEREWGRLVRLAFLLTKSQQTAEEIAQERSCDSTVHRSR